MIPRDLGYDCVMRSARSLAVLGVAIALAGCRSSAVPSAPPASSHPVSASASAPGPSSPSAPVASAAPAPAPDAGAGAPSACRVASAPESVDDKKGTASEYGTMHLENLRVLVDGDTTAITWERQADFTVGDSWREPVLVLRRGDGPFRVANLPVMAYACATSGHAGVLSASEPFVSWGARNLEGFEVWRDVPSVGPEPSTTIRSSAARTIPTRQHLGRLATSKSVALATAREPACPAAVSTPPSSGSAPVPADVCHCFTWKDGLWLFPLKAGAKPTLVAPMKDMDMLDAAPALAMGDQGGIGAYRSNGAIHVVFVDAAGGLAAPPVQIDRGEVGAPAVAVADGKAVVVWAKRAGKSAPYVLQWTTTDLTKREIPKTRTWATSGSAFAPSVVTDGATAAVTWMEGNDTSQGRVLFARAPLDREAPLEGLKVSIDAESNARDPEISGPVGAPTVVYAAFNKQRPGGVARVARVVCGS